MDVASGAIAFASVAIQLIDSVSKIQAFWESFKEAPDSIKAIAKDLRVLNSVLKEITSGEAHSHDSTTAAALESCAVQINILLSLMNEYQLDFALGRTPVRKWTAVKAAWSEGRIRKFRAALLESKITLLLARNEASQ